jgi:membrane fusion protein, heavy metal efflux system
MKAIIALVMCLWVLSACQKSDESTSNAADAGAAASAKQAHEHGHDHDEEKENDDHGQDDHGHEENGRDDHAEEEVDVHGHGHGHGEHEEEAEPAKGPNGGRLLVEGDVQLELAIFEDGVPPEYRAWISQNGKAIAPAADQLRIKLTRLGGKVDAIDFRAVEIAGKRFLQSTSEVTEPHSFDVAIALKLASKQIDFAYPSYEGRTTIPADVAKKSGITTAIAGPMQLSESRSFFAVVEVDPNRVANVSARFAGPIQQIMVGENATVRKGQALAVIQSNESLTNYTLFAPISGVITHREASVGAMAGANALFEITDLSEVHIDAQAFAEDARNLRVGQHVRVGSDSDPHDFVEGKIERIKPLADQSSGAVSFHAVIDNADGHWRPGQSALMRVLNQSSMAPLVIDERAVQRFRDWQVAFIQVGDTFEIRPLELGRSDGRWVEVKNGLQLGDRYVVEQSFLIKADIEKSGAAHDH